MAQQIILDAVTTAINNHATAIGCRDPDPEIQVWHMVASLLEFCDAQSPRISFDLILEEVRDHFAQEAANQR